VYDIRKLHSLLPKTNQLAKALISSVLNRLHPLIVNHFTRIRNLSHQLEAAPNSSSLLGRPLDVSGTDARFISRLMKGE
jgi:hypothetical protein